MNPFLLFLLSLLGLDRGGQEDPSIPNVPLSGPAPFPNERISPGLSQQTLSGALSEPTQKRLVGPSVVPEPIMGATGIPLDQQVFSGFRADERDSLKFSPDPTKNELSDRDPLRAFKSPLGMLREPMRPGGLPTGLDFGIPQLSFPTDPFESVGRIGPRDTLLDQELLDELNRATRLGAGNFGFDQPRVKRRRNEFLL